MQHTRRFLLKGGMALLAIASLPRTLLAAIWPEKVFSYTDAEPALEAQYGTALTIPSDKIEIKLPEIAENGAVVPVTINTTLKNVESISIVVKNNPRPMAAIFEIPPGTRTKIACRIKMGMTSKVMAVVKTNDGIYSTSKEVKVTIGGCGG